MRQSFVLHLDVLDAVGGAVDVEVYLEVDEVIADVANRMRINLRKVLLVSMLHA